ncbi:type VII secretion protein EccB [Streptomyces sp. AK02-01A]|uniref:type VII secretion protein EccB n=1 Tax=Streptomyces sp. AK02-01A TaxID=3028648 RepID=UPI0029A10FAB|nr:type VII secretion protein EccB [Streptomyces sp. AK02-01A]MDX3849470.1 type VII secretion protein EccB [Streptomyces sp. AK02-01A]
MQSRRDQVQAYSFTVGRLTSSMLMADPDAVDTPMSRTRRGSAIGLVIGALICVGFMVFGLLFPKDSDAWRKPGVLVMEKETGARYVYDGGTLRPVINYASAKLVTGDKGTVQQVSRSTLADVPRGTLIGIPGAPDSLPAADRLTHASWQVCATSRAADDGTRAPTTTLAAGIVPRSSVEFGPNEALLVTTRKGKQSTDVLLWHGTRFRLDSAHGALQSLGYGTVEALAVADAFLSAIPAGPDLAPQEVAGRGARGPRLSGQPRRVGQLFAVHTPGSPEQYYLLDRAGLVPLTLTELQLLRGDPRTRDKAYAGQRPAVVVLPPDEAAQHMAPKSTAAGAGPDALPARPPTALAPQPGSVPCLRVTPGGGAPRQAFVRVPAVSAAGAPVVARQGVAPSCPVPDAISVRPGSGVLAMPASAGAGASGARYLVTDDGIKYPLAAPAVAGRLSYTDQDLMRLPSALLRLLPTGPLLDPDRAAAPALSGPAPAAPDPECGPTKRSAP